MKKIVAVSASMLLCACIHQTPIPDVSNDMAQLDAAVQSRCTSFGYQPGTPDFNKCFYSVRSDFLRSVMVQVPPPPDLTIRAVAPPIQPVQTRCYSTAGVTNCSSY